MTIFEQEWTMDLLKIEIVADIEPPPPPHLAQAGETASSSAKIELMGSRETGRFREGVSIYQPISFEMARNMIGRPVRFASSSRMPATDLFHGAHTERDAEKQ